MHKQKLQTENWQRQTEKLKVKKYEAENTLGN